MRIRTGILIVAMAMLAVGCFGNPAGGGGGTNTTNQLEVTGDLTETIVLDQFSCPDELMGHVEGSTGRRVDLAFSNGHVIYLDDSGNTYTGTGTSSQKSDGSMTFSYDLTSPSGKKIHISGESACK